MPIESNKSTFFASTQAKGEKDEGEAHIKIDIGSKPHNPILEEAKGEEGELDVLTMKKQLTDPTVRGREIFREESQKAAVESHIAHMIPEAYHLPERYGDDRLIIQVRDPYWLHAYWEITDNLKEAIKKRIGHETFSRSYPILRIYDVTEHDITENKRPDYFDLRINGEANSWYINVWEPDRAYRVDLGLLTENKDFILMVRSNKVRTPRDGFSDVIDEEWMIIEDEYRKLYRLAIGYGIGDSSLELVESMLERHRREMGSGAISSISSPIKWQGAAEAKRPFWLTVQTELIVYGATEPDAKVMIQGNPIQLRSDGTFTLRFALPDGQEVIPIKATSSDGKDEITITPVVERRTTK
jgi:hypothetical protein